MANIATLNIGINALYGGAISGINKVTSSFSNMGSTMQRMTSTVTGFGTSFIGMTAGLAGIGSAIGGLTFGVKAAAEAEKAQAAFETMLKSPEAAKSLLADLNTFAAETPFELPGITAAAKKLLAFGTSADQVIPTLRALGDISSGVDAPLGEIAELFGKMQVQGRLFGEDINQLTGRGIPVIGEFAKQFGVADSEVRKLVEQGKIGFPELQRAIVSLTTGPGIFAGNTAKASKTLSGLWSTAKDNIGMSLKGIGETIIQTFDLKGAVGKLSGFVDYVANGWVAPIIQHIGAMAQFWGGMFSGVTPILFDVLETVRVGFIGLMATVQFVGNNMGDVLTLAGKTALLSLYAVPNFLIYTFGTVVPEALSYFGRNWQEIFRDMYNFTSTVFSNMYKNITSFWKSIFDYLYGNTDKLEFVWTPLTDGFKSAIKEALVITPREIGGMEKILGEQVSTLANKVGGNLQQSIATAVEKYKLPEAKALATKDFGAMKISDKSAAATMKPAKDAYEGPKALLEGSKDAFAAIAAFKNRKMEDAYAKDTEKNTANTVKEIQNLTKAVTNQAKPQVASF